MGHIWPKLGSDMGRAMVHKYYVDLIWATALHIKPICCSSVSIY